jgi:hypothetical protein
MSFGRPCTRSIAPFVRSGVRACALLAAAAWIAGAGGVARGEGDAPGGPGPATDVGRAAAPGESAERFGLTLSQRQAAFRDLMAAEEQAGRDAAKRFEAKPEAEGQVELAVELAARYQSEIAEKYGITERELVLIQAEGIEQSWGP